MSIIVYHGTTIENYQKIVEEGFKVKTHQNYVPNDLGDGIYSFANDKEQLWDPYTNALKFTQQFNSGNHVVVSIVIDDKNPVKILDLDTISFQRIWGKVRERFENKAELIWKGYHRGHAKRRHNLDGIIINYLFSRRIIKQPDIITKKTYTSFIPRSCSNFYNGQEFVIYNPNIISYYYVSSKGGSMTNDNHFRK